MIKGIGVDSVEISRVSAWLERQSADRFFAPAEIVYAQTHGGSAHLAACFALREAVAKALGVSLSEFGRRDVTLEHLPSGNPRVRLFERAAARAAELGIDAWHVSLSHDRNQAIVFVIAESRCEDER